MNILKHRIWSSGLALVTCLLVLVVGSVLQAASRATPPMLLAQQEAAPSPEAAPDAVPVAPLPGSATQYQPPSPSPLPSPGFSPRATPTGSPAPTPTPLPTVAPPPLTAVPLPTAGEYKDPAQRFRVAILQDYSVTPIGDAVLLEAKDGHLAYTALARRTTGTLLNDEGLVQLAQSTFQRGEGFQAGPAQPIVGGIRLDWTGSLTIGGQTQPVSGVIVAKPAGENVLLLLIAATAKAADKIPNALSALADGLQSLQ